jgi:hypothetical protein
LHLTAKNRAGRRLPVFVSATVALLFSSWNHSLPNIPLLVTCSSTTLLLLSCHSFLACDLPIFTCCPVNVQLLSCHYSPAILSLSTVLSAPAVLSFLSCMSPVCIHLPAMSLLSCSSVTLHLLFWHSFLAWPDTIYLLSCHSFLAWAWQYLPAFLSLSTHSSPAVLSLFPCMACHYSPAVLPLFSCCPVIHFLHGACQYLLVVLSLCTVLTFHQLFCHSLLAWGLSVITCCPAALQLLSCHYLLSVLSFFTCWLVTIHFMSCRGTLLAFLSLFTADYLFNSCSLATLHPLAYHTSPCSQSSSDNSLSLFPHLSLFADWSVILHLLAYHSSSAG